MIAILSTIENFWKTKIKSYGDEATEFYKKQVPIVSSKHICLAVINIDSALKNDESCYPQVFLTQCNVVKSDYTYFRRLWEFLSRFWWRID